jgi:hypothetical protein
MLSTEKPPHGSKKISQQKYFWDKTSSSCLYCFLFTYQTNRW